MRTVQQKYRKPKHSLLKIRTQGYKLTRKKEISENELFEDFLLEVIDECLCSLGESVKQAIYFHLERRFKIKRSEIPTKIDKFVEAIENIFGEGAKLLEIEIMKRLHERSGHLLDDYSREDDLQFIEFLKTFANVRVQYF